MPADPTYIGVPMSAGAVSYLNQWIARRAVDRTAGEDQEECPRYQEEEIKIEINVVYHERFVRVSKIKRKRWR